MPCPLISALPHADARESFSFRPECFVQAGNWTDEPSQERVGTEMNASFPAEGKKEVECCHDGLIADHKIWNDKISNGFINIQE